MGGIYWLASYPKSGNTWFRTVLKNYTADAETPVDINALNTGQIASSRSWVDDVAGFDTADLTQDEINNLRPDVYRWSLRENETGYHKIHDAYETRPDGRPIVDDVATLGAVYLLRNPLDVAPSLAGHLNCDLDMAIARMGQEDFALSKPGKALSSQLLQRLGTWSFHVQSWADAPGLNRHVLRYEDMQAAPEASFGAALAFLGFAPDPERLAKAVAFSRFDVVAAQEQEKGFRERPSKAERFFREGRSGGWRSALSDAQVAQVIADHAPVMRRFGYLDASDQPV